MDPQPSPSPWSTCARDVVADLSASQIRLVANAGLARDDVLAFWFGESDEATPVAVREAAASSLRSGETFYSHNLGLPALREAVAAYASLLHRPHQPLTAERVAITSSGVNALMVAQQALVNPGDEVVVVVPVWPNLCAQPRILGACLTEVSLQPDGAGAWQLDLGRLLAAVTSDTRVLLLNSPNNPTGWTLGTEEQAQILAHCRRTGTWIVADEVYERLYYPTPAPDQPVDGRPVCAPSFLDIADARDRLVVVQSFSKSFLMTGWRLGALIVPPLLMDDLGKLLEFNTSCAPVFVQRAGIEALRLAEQTVPALQAHLRRCRDTLVEALADLPGVQAASPPGAMYVFLRVAGARDSLVLAQRLVAEQGLGLAPGVAFGASGEGWLRWCFASREVERLRLGVQRLTAALPL
jgi:aspartate/methionine/tyrosine aminotransferase